MQMSDEPIVEPIGDDIETLFANNRAWAAQMELDNPGFFNRLADQQSPRYLWIGCADSRVPANQITGLLPGEVFVHRNVANVVFENDLNCMAVLEFAVRVLKVRHVIVCGHYGCAGVRAARERNTEGVVDSWLSGLRELWDNHKAELAQLDSVEANARLSELNVCHQVRAVGRTSVVRRAWEEGMALDVHGWIYGVEDGLLRDLDVRMNRPAD